MVDPDRQLVVVGIPQQLEDVFGEEPRVGEHQRRAMVANLLVELGYRPGSSVAAPRNARFLRQQDIERWRSPRLALDQRHRVAIAARGEPAAEGVGIGHGGGQRSPLQARGDRLKPGQRQREQIAPLAGRKRMDLVDHHPPQTGKQRVRIRITQQQRQRLRGGQQDMWGMGALPGLAVARGVAAAGFDSQRQSEIGDRSQEVALDIVSQRLERRDVQGV